MTQTIDPHDTVAAELASLFLTGPEVPLQRDMARGAEIEVLIVGHLPVLADLWLAPYADAVAREHGPCVLLRIEADHARLRVLRPTADLVLPSAGGSLADAVDTLGPQVGGWIVRPAPQTALPVLLAAADERLVVLSSAEDFARIAAYQRIKALVEEAARSGRRPPKLGVSILGAPLEAARRAQSLLDDTASASLGIQVPLVRSLERIDSNVHATDWVGFDGCAVDLEGILARIRGVASAPAARDTPSALRAPAPAVQPAVEPTPRPAPHPKGDVELEPKSPVAAGEPDHDGAPCALSSFIEGLDPLPVRCPGHERPELAVDSSGRLHVLARDSELRELLIVQAWAARHLELIGLACPGQPLDPASGNTGHVFTDEPVRVSDLHGSGLRLHVLSPVTVEGRRGWYVAPLNRAP